jgi:ribose-phosphate pyrophosphokinase
MDFKIFAPQSTEDFGKKICDHLEISLSSLEERAFEDGEHKMRPLESVRGLDVYVIQSLYSDIKESVNDKICKLLFFTSTLRDSSAKKVTVVIPYFAYGRKDRRTKDRDPVTFKYLARLIEASGADQVISIDVHNTTAFQNAFRIPTEHLEGRVLFPECFKDILTNQNAVVVSPDAGGIKRAESFRTTLMDVYKKDIGKAFIEKERTKDSILTGGPIIGDVKNKICIIIDDIISTGNTIKHTLNALDKALASDIYVCATHGVLTEKSKDLLDHPKLKKIFITDTIIPWRIKDVFPSKKIEVIDSTPLFAKALKRMQEGNSLTELLQRYPHAVQELSCLN